MSSVALGQVRIECVTGDITRQVDADVIVNAANAELMPGGGVAGAIHRAAGPELAAICRPLAPIRPGEAVITEGCRLPAPYVIHCLGPVYGRDEPSNELLARCYRQALRLAEQHQLRSIAFPALSTGAFGYPMEDAARVAFESVREAAPGLSHVNAIRFVLFSERDTELHERVMMDTLEP